MLWPSAPVHYVSEPLENGMKSKIYASMYYISHTLYWNHENNNLPIPTTTAYRTMLPKPATLCLPAGCQRPPGRR
jgi:hypothetical protein